MADDRVNAVKTMLRDAARLHERAAGESVEAILAAAGHGADGRYDAGHGDCQ